MILHLVTTALRKGINLFVLLMLLRLAGSQESPTLFADKFDYSKSFRTNVCQQQVMLFNETVTLPDALRGLNLTVAITNYQSGKEADLFTLVNNTIQATSPGYFTVILDEVARRAGFSWRNSFGVYLPRDNVTDGGKSWTDILIWAIETYDISMERWAHSVDRMALGASFPMGFWDSSAVLGEILEPRQKKRVVHLWSFLKPFEHHVWIGIAGVILLTGLVYWVLEFWNKDTDERDLDGKPWASIFFAAIAFAGHYELRPSSHAARIVGFSFTFWALIVASAYTANLASFLVSPNVAVYKFSTPDQVLKRNAKVCVQEGAALQQLLRKMYPKLVMVGKNEEIDIFKGLRLPLDRGGCDAVAHQLNSYELYEHTKEVNYDCAISSEKRIAAVMPAGMATLVDNGPVPRNAEDSPSRCTSLIGHVLDYHLSAMANEGFIEDAWKKHVQRTSTIECISRHIGVGGGLEETFSLSVYDVGGIFIVHVVLSCIAVALATYQFYVKARNEQIEDNRTLGKAFGLQHFVSVAKLSNMKRRLRSDSSRPKMPSIPEGEACSRIPDTELVEEESTMRDSTATRNSSQRFDLSDDVRRLNI